MAEEASFSEQAGSSGSARAAGPSDSTETEGDSLVLPDNGVRVKIPAEAGVTYPEYQRMQTAMLDMVALVSHLADANIRDPKLHRSGRDLEHVSIVKASYGSPDELIALVNDAIGFVASNDVKTAVQIVGGLFLVTLPGAFNKIQSGLWAQEQRLASRQNRISDQADSDHVQEAVVQSEAAPPVTQTHALPATEDVDAFADAIAVMRQELGRNPSRQADKMLVVLETARAAYADGRLPNELQVFYSAMFIANRGGIVDQGGASQLPDGDPAAGNATSSQPTQTNLATAEIDQEERPGAGA